MKKGLIIAAISLVTLLCSCSKEIKFNGVYDGEKLVLYSFANLNTRLTARVYKSRFFLAKDYNYEYELIDNVELSVDVNGDRQYPFVREGNNYVSEYVPQEGDHIKVTASHKDFKTVYGETDVPKRPKFGIDSYKVTQSGRLEFDLTIQDPEEEDNYYRLNAWQNQKFEWEEEAEFLWINHSIYSNDPIFNSSQLGSYIDKIDGSDPKVPDFFDDGAFDGSSHCFRFWINFDHHEEDKSDDIRPEDFKLTVDAVSESLYRYSLSREAANNMDGIAEIFGEPVSIYNNIVNGIGRVGAVSRLQFSFDGRYQ